MLQMLLQLFWKTFMVPCTEICTSLFMLVQSNQSQNKLLVGNTRRILCTNELEVDKGAAVVS